MRDQSSGNLPPQYFAALAIQAQYHKFILGIGVGNPKDALGLIFRFGKGWIDFSGIDGCKDKDLVAPNDGRGTAISINGDLPLDILIFIPVCWRFGGGRGAGGIRSTPVMPVIGLGLWEIRGVGVENEGSQN